MSFNRYNFRNVMYTDQESQFKILDRRGLKYARFLSSPNFFFPSDDIINSIEYYKYSWTQGDKMYKVSSKFYGDPSYWWIILLFNKIPSEMNLNAGDLVKIPARIEEIIGLYRV